MAGEVPILGVCLGLQCIGEAFGGKVVRADRLMHGKTSPIIHDGKTIFAGIPSPFDAMRYHSLLVDAASIPPALEVSARTAENEIMGLRHKQHAVEGVQFHPESILTFEGKHLLQNFLDRLEQERNCAMSGLHDALQALIDGRSLTDAEAELAIGEIMDGGAHDAVVGAFLVALKIKGAEADELAGAVRAMLERARPLNLRDGEVLDTCGTGGDGASTFNISTGAALIAAAAGVPVAKHGNRAISGTVGTADVLEAMGVKIDCDPEGLKRCLDAAGCCHIFAQAYHPAFKKIAPLRRELRIRTIFNLMGAIGNPARPHFHLLGVAEENLIRPMAHALKALGTRRAMVVHGGDGIDEIAISGPTRVAELRDGEMTEYEITPESLGVARGDHRALVIRNLDDAVRVLRGALDGGAGPAQDVLALNGGAAIYVGGKAASLKEGVDAAREIIASSRALEVLDKLRRASNGEYNELRSSTTFTPPNVSKCARDAQSCRRWRLSPKRGARPSRAISSRRCAPGVPR